MGNHRSGDFDVSIDMYNRDRIERLKNIESKYEYINMICSDQNGLATEQKDIIKNQNYNYSEGIGNTKAGAEKLATWYDYREKKTKRNCLMIQFIIIIMIFTINFLKIRIESAY